MTWPTSESSLTIFKGFSCVPDRNNSRSVPRSAFAFTRYLNPPVSGGVELEASATYAAPSYGMWKPYKGSTRDGVPFRRCCSRSFLHSLVQMSISRLNLWNGSAFQLGSEEPKIASSPSSPSHRDRRRRAFYTKLPCRGRFLDIGRRSHIHRRENQT